MLSRVRTLSAPDSTNARYDSIRLPAMYLINIVLFQLMILFFEEAQTRFPLIFSI